MNCTDLARRIQNFEPNADTTDVARLCLLLSIAVDDANQLNDDEKLKQSWREASLRLQFATDQHAAMTEELEDLAASDPKQFSSEQIWVLIRAIKVQSQILQLYIGEAALDV